MDPLVFLSDHATTAWAALSAGLSGLGTWLISLRNISATVERSRIAMGAEIVNAEAVERASFRSALMTEVTEMRKLIKDSETEKEILRQRLNAAEGQIIVLKASNEIMERWIAFFNERGTAIGPVVPKDLPTRLFP